LTPKETGPFHEHQTLAEERPSILTFSATDSGSVREVNEDAVAVVCPQSYEDMLSTGVLAVVADGMGGANGGQCASHLAASVIPRVYADTVKGRHGNPGSALLRALEAANSCIYSRAQSDESLSGMGTTCVAVALTPKQAWVAWVGDSRVYLMREDGLFQMTEDHSVVAGMVREGLLTPEQASFHGERHVLTKALGTRPEVEVASWPKSMQVRVGDRFLLCTDGLHDLLSEEDLLQLGGRGSLPEAAAALVRKAKERGGPDNISAVLLEVSSQQ
jgi:serine/threonine protein phosphatase PrpC